MGRWESKTGKGRRPIKGVTELVSTVDNWSSVLLGPMGENEEPHLRTILPKGCGDTSSLQPL